MKEMRIKAVYVSQHKSKRTGTPTFVYEMRGATPEQIERLKEAQGDNYRANETTGVPLFFTTVPTGNTLEVIVTQTNKVVADRSKFDQAAALSKAYGGNLGEQIAKEAAKNLLGDLNLRPAGAEVVANEPGNIDSGEKITEKENTPAMDQV